MVKPSIFSSDYHRAMKRRKTIFRVLIVLAALAIIFVTYNKSIISDIGRIAEDLRIHLAKPSPDKGAGQNVPKVSENLPAKNSDSKADSKQANNIVKGQYIFKFPNNDTINILYDKQGNNIKLTGISPSGSINFSIRDDAKAIIFDNPKLSDIWIYNADGTYKVLGNDTYTQIGGDGISFSKSSIMARYQNKYIWAERPKYLKDGRIVYQSNLPWFSDENNYYLWIMDSSGKNSRMVFKTGQPQPIKYSGFTADGKLIIEMGGIKYRVDVDDGSKQKID